MLIKITIIIIIIIIIIVIIMLNGYKTLLVTEKKKRRKRQFFKSGDCVILSFHFLVNMPFPWKLKPSKFSCLGNRLFRFLT